MSSTDAGSLLEDEQLQILQTEIDLGILPLIGAVGVRHGYDDERPVRRCRFRTDPVWVSDPDRSIDRHRSDLVRSKLVAITDDN